MASDLLFYDNLQFYGYHGAAEEERSLGQRFEVDVELEVDQRRAGLSDDLNDAVDYGAVFSIVQAIMEGPSRKLIESLAEAVAGDLLATFPAQAVTVTVRKPNVPIAGVSLRAVGVRIRRERSATEATG
jgi:dihydroneopterin aldolase